MAPVINGLNPNAGSTAGGNPVVITGTGFTGATAVKFGTASAPFTVVSNTQINATAPAGTGSVAVTVTAPSGTSSAVLYLYLTAPVISGLNPDQGPATGGNPVILTGGGFTGATTVKFGTASAPFTVVSNTQINATAPTGTGSVAVTVTTPKGTGSLAAYTYLTVPAISGLSPSQGPTTGGNTVTISGTGLSSATSVKFGAVSVPFLIVNDTQINATAPAGTGSVAVTVTTPGGTSSGTTYTYIPVPVINTLNPSQGPTTGGNTITISGTGLSSATSVKFGAVSASFTIAGDTQINATAPAGTGSASVTVTTPNGTSNGVPYSYVAAPVVTGITPDMGPGAGGNTVTIAGNNLASANTATFGPNTATNLTVISDSQITVTAPSGTGTVTVTVTTPSGSSPSDQGNPFYTYLGVPAITSLTPSQGPASGGTDVAIAGNNLTYTGDVRFGGTPASFATVSDNLVLATAPAAAPGTVTVTLHTPGGDSNGVSYLYQP